MGAAGAAPSAGGTAPSTGGAAPSTGGATPSTGGTAPSTGGTAPSAVGTAPSTGGTPSAGGAGSTGAGSGSGAGGGGGGGVGSFGCSLSYSLRAISICLSLGSTPGMSSTKESSMPSPMSLYFSVSTMRSSVRESLSVSVCHDRVHALVVHSMRRDGMSSCPQFRWLCTMIFSNSLSSLLIFALLESID